MSLLKVK